MRAKVSKRASEQSRAEQGRAERSGANVRSLCAGRVIFRSAEPHRLSVLPGEKGFRGIKIVFMECLKEPETHFPAVFPEFRG